MSEQAAELPERDTTPGNRRPETVRSFDFRRPTILSREQVRSLQIVQETLARGFTTTLASALRAAIQVSISDIEQHSYDEFTQTLSNPTLLTTLSTEPLEGAALLDISSRSAFMAIELLLGGSGSPDQPRRAMTDLELSLMRGIVELLLPEVAHAFAPIASIQPRIVSQETNPQFVQLAGPTDMVIVISFELTIEGVTDTMSLCIPFGTLQGRLEAMAARSRFSNESPEKLLQERSTLERQVSTAIVPNSVVFRPTLASSTQIQQMSEGDVLLLNHPVSVPLSLRVNRIDTHLVRIGRLNRHYAVQVVEEVDAESYQRPARLEIVSGAD